MATIMNPKCAQQVWLMESEELAGECGWWGNFFGAIGLTLVICCITCCCVVFLLGSREVDAQGKPVLDKDGKPKKPPIVSIAGSVCYACCCLIFIWGLALLFGSWSKKQEWREGQAKIEGYMAQGMSRKKAISKLQDLQEANIEAQATRDMGSTIASGLAVRSVRPSPRRSPAVSVSPTSLQFDLGNLTSNIF